MMVRLPVRSAVTSYIVAIFSENRNFSVLSLIYKVKESLEAQPYPEKNSSQPK